MFIALSQHNLETKSASMALTYYVKRVTKNVLEWKIICLDEKNLNKLSYCKNVEFFLSLLNVKIGYYK